MNCAEFRERLLIDPHDPALAAAAQEGICPDAELQLKRALGFERRLRQALELDVPADLAVGIRSAVLGQPAAANSRAPGKLRRSWLALAASLTLGTVIGGWWLSQDQAALLARECVAHLAHEPYALTRQRDVPEALVSRMFSEIGVSLQSQPGAVQYSMPCKVGEYRTLHMVAQTEFGPVTVMYVANPPSVQRHEFNQAAVSGRIVPMGAGALVLMAEHSRDFDPLEMRFRAAIEGAEPRTVAGSI